MNPKHIILLCPSILSKRILRGAEIRRKMLSLAWDGRTIKQIASDLKLGTKSAEYHWNQLTKIFQSNNPITVCRRAKVRGLIK